MFWCGFGLHLCRMPRVALFVHDAVLRCLLDGARRGWVLEVGLPGPDRSCECRVIPFVRIGARRECESKRVVVCEVSGELVRTGKETSMFGDDEM